jgi:predicted transposase YdaD
VINHDQLFKLLLQTFFREFLAAFAPEIHAALKPSAIHFLDKELIGAHSGQRKTKLVDLVARVRLAGGDGFVLVHIEHQARRERDIGRRMFLYAAWLMQRYGLPVYPILLTSYDQPREAEPHSYQVIIRCFQVLDFRYRVIQLNRLSWRIYAKMKNPAATALMAKMRIAARDRFRVKLQMLRLIATLRLQPAKMDLIAGFMESYLALNAKEELAFQASLDKIGDTKERQQVMQLVTSWERRGRHEGRHEGRNEGRQEGQSETVRRQLRILLGRLTSTQERMINLLDCDQLSDLAEALLRFSSAKDLDRWLARHRC